MANHANKKKLHSFSKSERLCNFSLKKLLFEKGNTLHTYPLKLYWLPIDKNLEHIFFQKSTTCYSGALNKSNTLRQEQNPSFPHKIIPPNALFPFPVQCLIAASGKVHKKAVLRNHLKRLLREAYRKNKAPFYSFVQHSGKLMLMAIIYTGKTQPGYADIEKKIIVSLQRIQETIAKQQDY